MRAYTGGGADLVWYGAAGDRTKTSINAFGILDDFRGVLVRDDFGGYLSYDAELAGSSNAWPTCCATSTTPTPSTPTPRPGPARSPTPSRSDPRGQHRPRRRPNHPGRRTVSRLRRRYDNGRGDGISTNLSRPWHKGNHPGLQLARRLKRKAHQVWLFTTRFDVPPTNNGSESAIRGFNSPPRSKAAAHPGHPAAALPDPVLPGQRPQPRTPTHRRHPRRPNRKPLDATPNSMIHRGHP